MTFDKAFLLPVATLISMEELCKVIGNVHTGPLLLEGYTTEWTRRVRRRCTVRRSLRVIMSIIMKIEITSRDQGERNHQTKNRLEMVFFEEVRTRRSISVMSAMDPGRIEEAGKVETKDLKWSARPAICADRLTIGEEVYRGLLQAYPEIPYEVDRSRSQGHRGSQRGKDEGNPVAVEPDENARATNRREG
ncbi:hypothetical protein BD410DRAFT_807027 [Rickenella mellea]|uniref:Uncharacterized protein n=1 Tax=Rickenella mellea TaxID=50990 RepID=A0A4Y7PRR1_9AGAM|nr:hypothetical protein BD410DRAFT_807027 [Rickenella mellea]